MDLKTKDFKDTLLMPKTDFPMRGNLGVNELPIQAKWEELNIYEKVVKKNFEIKIQPAGVTVIDVYF